MMDLRPDAIDDESSDDSNGKDPSMIEGARDSGGGRASRTLN